MTAAHPTELVLQQYLNQSLSPAEVERVGSHLEHCPQCRNAVAAYRKLELLLPGLPLEAPSPGFTDRLMAKLEEESERTSGTVAAAAGAERSRTRFWRPELANAMVATAATYLFLSSGIYKALLTWNPSVLEVGLEAGTASLSAWVGRISQVLPF